MNTTRGGEEAKILLREAERCLYCGFCEAVCPTLEHGLHRGYGPRGRLSVIVYMTSAGKVTPEAVASLYSCLTCGACTVKCPLSINVAKLVKTARSLYVSGFFREKALEAPIAPRRR
ncbi:MAG: (Fe-S)-binding protein [Pyrodictiaceae archaeon]